MKILYYNWVNFWQSKTGGGVSVYQKNLLDTLGNMPDIKLTYLSSGYKFNMFVDKTYIRKSKPGYANIACYELINSTVTAPAWKMFNNLGAVFNNTDCRVLNALIQFIHQQGGFDILHLNNIEGLPLNFLQLKKHFPNMKIVYSIHNYVSFCPLVELYNHKKRCICEDPNRTKDCSGCFSVCPPLSRKAQSDICAFFFQNKILSCIYKYICRHVLLKKKSIPVRQNFETPLNLVQTYPSLFVEQLNKNVDIFLSVSKRVKEIASNFGIDSKRNYVSYIGTKVAEQQLGHQKYVPNGEYLTIAYLGYALYHKGFEFFIKALETLPEPDAKKINVKLCAAKVKPHLMKRIENLKTKFASVEHINGFTHETLPNVLENVNLGIVPVLWEDNLPQVAIEMVSHGIPVLCSSSGGASELCTDDAFRYTVNNIKSFQEKLQVFISNPKRVCEYWNNHHGLTTMKQHINELLQIYSANYHS